MEEEIHDEHKVMNGKAEKTSTTGKLLYNNTSPNTNRIVVIIIITLITTNRMQPQLIKYKTRNIALHASYTFANKPGYFNLLEGNYKDGGGRYRRVALLT